MLGPEWPDAIERIAARVQVIVNGTDDLAASLLLYRTARARRLPVIDAYASPLPSIYVTRPGEAMPEERLGYPTIDKAWNALAKQATDQLAAEGFIGDAVRLRRSAALHYKGQSYELTVPVPDGPIDAQMATHLEQAFAEEHERTYGHRAGPDEPVELVAIQLVGSGLREGSGVPKSIASSRRNGSRSFNRPPRRGSGTTILADG